MTAMDARGGVRPPPLCRHHRHRRRRRRPRGTPCRPLARRTHCHLIRSARWIAGGGAASPPQHTRCRPEGALVHLASHVRGAADHGGWALRHAFCRVASAAAAAALWPFGSPVSMAWAWQLPATAARARLRAAAGTVGEGGVCVLWSRRAEACACATISGGQAVAVGGAGRSDSSLCCGDGVAAAAMGVGASDVKGSPSSALRGSLWPLSWSTTALTQTGRAPSVETLGTG